MDGGVTVDDAAFRIGQAKFSQDGGTFLFCAVPAVIGILGLVPGSLVRHKSPGKGLDAPPANGAVRAAPEIPQTLVDQLKVGGMMVIPLCENETHQTMLRLTKQEDGSLKREEYGNFRFVPMLKGVGTD